MMTLRDIRNVWRILAAVAACQLAGGLIGLLVGFHHFWFMNFWLGGALGTVPGFVLGAIWQFRRHPERRGAIGIAVFLGFLSAALLGMAIGVALPRMSGEMRLLDEMARLQDEPITRIDVFDRYGDKRLLSVTAPDDLAAFARGCSDAVGHSPNHPVYSHSWYVVVEGKPRHEFELHLHPEFPDCVIGYFVTKAGNSTAYYGHFASRGLRPWMQRHLAALEAAGGEEAPR